MGYLAAAFCVVWSLAACEVSPEPRAADATAAAAIPPAAQAPPPKEPKPVQAEVENDSAVQVEADEEAGIASAAPPAPPTAASGPVEIYPHLWLDREANHLDARGHVIAQQFEWLELLACRPGTREHEAIVTIDAEAQHLQLGLLLLGLEPGQPATATREAGRVTVTPPHGPEVELYFILDDQPETLIPANTWVVDQQTGQTLVENRWLFLGSKLVEHQGRTFFLAEDNGTLVSLVNFGDELLGRATDAAADGGNDLWTAAPDLLPPAGTPITLRLRPAVQ